MANRREILDSDDEESLSPLRGPTPVLDDEATHHVNDEPDASRSRRAESTDPSFFRNVYEEHHTAAQDQETHKPDIEPISSTSSGGIHQRHDSRPSSITDPVAPFSERHDTSHLSSITDPVAGNRERRKAEKKKVIDLTLTQVTTPGRPDQSSTTDIWEFPASQDTSSKTASSDQTGSIKKKVTIKLKKTEKKRKSDLGSSAQTPTSPDTGLLPALSINQGDVQERPPNRKKRRVSEHGQSSEDVDLLVIPRSEETGQYKTSPTVPNTSSGDVVENTHKPHSNGLFVVPNTLTPSQKEQYKFVSLSTEADESPKKAGLSTGSGGIEDMHNSSDTVAFPTPTAYASSLPKMPPPAEPQGSSVLKRALAKMRRKSKPVVEDPRSSPDVISAPTRNPPSAKKRQSPRSETIHPTDEDPYAMPSTISPPPRTVIRHSEMQPVDEDPYAMPSTISPPPPSAIRRAKTKLVPEAAMSPISASEKVEQPKRGRGRPKRLRSGTVGEDDDLRAAIAASLAELEEQKNNREVDNAATSPSKLPAAMDQQASGDEPFVPPVIEEDSPAVIQEEPPKKKRGRKKKEVKVDPVIDEGEADMTPQAPEEMTVPPPDLEAETPKPKRKRGRPRKSDTIVAPEPEVLPDANDEADKQEPVPADDDADNQPLKEPEERAPAKKARKSTDGSNHQGGDETTSVLSERDNNSSIGASGPKSATPALDVTDTTAKENKAVETPVKKDAKKEEQAKSGLSSSQVGKVQYRVGLSKKSRIAPLLKSLRKP